MDFVLGAVHWWYHALVIISIAIRIAVVVDWLRRIDIVILQLQTVHLLVILILGTVLLWVGNNRRPLRLNAATLIHVMRRYWRRLNNIAFNLHMLIMKGVQWWACPLCCCCASTHSRHALPKVLSYLCNSLYYRIFSTTSLQRPRYAHWVRHWRIAVRVSHRCWALAIHFIIIIQPNTF